MAELREWTLSRGIEPPVVFVGEMLHHHDGIGQTSLWQSLTSGGRWHAVSIFRTREGRFVVYLTFRSRVKGELDNREVFWSDQANGLSAVFARYQQVAFPVIAQRMQGSPEKCQRDAVDLLARYQRQVEAALAAVPAAVVKIS